MAAGTGGAVSWPVTSPNFPLRHFQPHQHALAPLVCVQSGRLV